jgi:hypothetical protein
VHSNNERIGVDNLQKGIAVYAEFLGRLWGWKLITSPFQIFQRNSF